MVGYIRPKKKKNIPSSKRLHFPQRIIFFFNKSFCEPIILFQTYLYFDKFLPNELAVVGKSINSEFPPEPASFVLVSRVSSRVMTDHSGNNYIVVKDGKKGRGMLYVHSNVAYKKYYSRRGAIFVKCSEIPDCDGRGFIRNDSFWLSREHCFHPKTYDDGRVCTPPERERSIGDKASIRLDREQYKLWKKLARYPSLLDSINELIDNREYIHDEKFIRDDDLYTKRVIQRLSRYPDIRQRMTELVNELENVNDETFVRDINLDTKFFINKHFVLSKDEKRDVGRSDEPPSSRFMIFASSKLREIINEYDGSFFIARTFKSLPFVFDNLFTFYVEYANHFVPIVYALTTQRTEKLYADVFKSIQNLTQHAGFKPSVIISDWDMDCLKALSLAYPRAKIKGCWYHYAVMLYEKVKKFGLRREFSRNEGLRCQIQLLMCLPFLRPSQIRETFFSLQSCAFENLEICSQTRSRLDEYYEEFSDCWIGKIDPNFLSVFGLKHRTNGFNRRFRDSITRRVGVASPKMSRFFSHLGRAIDEMDNDFAILSNGVTRPDWNEKLDEKHILRYEECNLTRGVISPWTFLFSIRRCSQKVIHEFLQQLNVEDDNIRIADETAKERENDNRVVCNVCFANRKNAAIIPCGHTLCTACYYKIVEDSARRHCPECRGPIDEFVKLFGF